MQNLSMNIYYNSLFLVFFFIVFLMILDKNVADYLILLLRWMKLNTQRLMWLTVNHPLFFTNPLIKRFLFFKYYLQARKIKKELE